MVDVIERKPTRIELWFYIQHTDTLSVSVCIFVLSFCNRTSIWYWLCALHTCTTHLRHCINTIKKLVHAIVSFSKVSVSISNWIDRTEFVSHFYLVTWTTDLGFSCQQCETHLLLCTHLFTVAILCLIELCWHISWIISWDAIFSWILHAVNVLKRRVTHERSPTLWRISNEFTSNLVGFIKPFVLFIILWIMPMHRTFSIYSKILFDTTEVH